ncbi:hypothetical protein FHU13_002485 [Methylobacterium sp. R2-1]|nr:hypothetical protein [Methylobacterium sp. R2-1]
MGAQSAVGLGAAILVSEWTFACAACGSPAVTWPADPTAEAAIACGGCARPLGTLAAFRAGIEGVLAAHNPRQSEPGPQDLPQPRPQSRSDAESDEQDMACAQLGLLGVGEPERVRS